MSTRRIDELFTSAYSFLPAYERRPVLDPLARAAEVIFGLLMAMSFSGSLSVATAGQQEIRTMMYAALGCNLAWGIVDAVMYLIITLTVRARNMALLRRVRGTTDRKAAHESISEAMPGRLGEALGEDVLEVLRQRLVAISNPPTYAQLRLDDLRGAIGVFFLVVLATFPIVVPFMFIPDAALALRVSNSIGLVILFAAGYCLGRYVEASPWRPALALAAVGAALFFAIIALGG